MLPYLRDMLAKFTSAALLVTLVALCVPVGGFAFPVPVQAPADASPVDVGHHHHSNHDCCGNLHEKQFQLALVMLPVGLPCGPNHSCCVSRAPANVPALQVTSSQEQRINQVYKGLRPAPINVAETVIVLAHASLTLSRDALSFTTVLRI